MTLALLGGLWFAIMALLASCGEDGGNGDTLLSGFSLFVIIVIGFFIVRHFMGRSRD